MSVQFYTWGVVPSGGGSGGGGTPYGAPEQFSGALGIGDTTITFSKATKSVTIRNSDDVDSFSFSFDGVNFMSIGPYGSYTGSVSTTTIVLRSTAVGVDYNVIGVLVD